MASMFQLEMYLMMVEDLPFGYRLNGHFIKFRSFAPNVSQLSAKVFAYRLKESIFLACYGWNRYPYFTGSTDSD